MCKKCCYGEHITNRQEEIKELTDIDLDEENYSKVEKQFRKVWLSKHGGYDGNDQCATIDCRITCDGCDIY